MEEVTAAGLDCGREPAELRNAEAQKRADQAARRAAKLAKKERRAERDGAAPQVKVRQQRPALSPEQAANAGLLQACGVGQRIAEELARVKTTTQIARTVAALEEQIDSVASTGGWLNRALREDWFAQEPAPEGVTKSEADLVREREARKSQPAAPRAAEDREAALQARRQREAEQEQAERSERAEVTARNTAAILGALEPAVYAALREQATAVFGGRAMPEGVIVGQMLTLLEADRRRPRAFGRG